MKEKKVKMKENEAETKMNSEKLGRVSTTTRKLLNCLENTAQSRKAEKPQKLLKNQIKAAF